jgi:hypothetical protein
MTTTKKNTGCQDCEHYFLSGNIDACLTKLTLKKTKSFDYLVGEYDSTKSYYPPRENANLICKGFTPIDYKAKYEAYKTKYPKNEKNSLMVSVESYERIFIQKEKLKCAVSNWQIISFIGWTILILVCVGMYFKICN